MTGHTPHADLDAPESPPFADETKIQQALQSILTSPEFDGALRLQSFLSYVVREALAGRGGDIMAKTIAEDVYEKSLDHGNDPPAVVRVDAGRLRRKLDEYYDHSGKDDPLRIHIDPGGYCPRFEDVPQPQAAGAQTTDAPAGRRTRAVVFVLAASLALNIALLSLFLTDRGADISVENTTSTARNPVRDTRAVLSVVSPRRLQAINLALQTRDLMFPVPDIGRLNAVMDLFVNTTELDGDYFGGFAGAAQVQALIALLQAGGPERAIAVSSARQFAADAMKRAPEEGWSHSALAVIAFAERDFDAALSHSERAVMLAPDDRHVLRFEALIALFAGEFERTLSATGKLSELASAHQRGVFRNAAAAAHYHLGHYDETMRIHREAARAGDPVSAINLSYLAAAQARTGQSDQARETLELIARSWPDFPIDLFLRGLFRSPRHADDVISQLDILRGNTD